MFKKFAQFVIDIFVALKNSFYSFIAQCRIAYEAAIAKGEGKSAASAVGEHVSCAVCEFGVDLLKRAIKIFLSSVIAYFGGRFFGRFLPVHAGWHREIA